MDISVKKLVKEAGSALSRVVQFTEEKLGTSEKTELDTHYENLALRSETYKQWTEKIVRDTETVLTPHPGNRIEDFIFEKIEKKKPNRLSNLECLGLNMVEAGNDFGPDTPYGSALIKVGTSEQKLGQCERDFIGTAGLCFIEPLRKFLEGEMKNVTKEKSILEIKRLDLDACKNRVRKARSMIGQQMAERDLRVAQSEFDRQSELTKLLMEKVATSNASHLRHLHDFISAQTQHYEQCHVIMKELQNDLVALGGSVSYTSGNVEVNRGTAVQHTNRTHKARVLYDYDAKDSTELSLMADEEIIIWDCFTPDPDYVMAERGSQRGRIPRSFLKFIK
ncbi:Endophilin-B1 [Eumeta japonica]|uniref:Endophilin-B1 n=1 Tax=Eumeta variegata TaxID=151549 RepID=A0A4C1TE49_EUMVA|nr:Endophilin-B1 [Eumeta japonica]